MIKALRQDLRTALVAAITASVVAAPAATAAVIATNSDKVDGKHAVGAGASKQTRAGKLVATDSTGVLPNNIIDKAPDANKLDGLDATAFLGANGKAADAEALDGLDSTALRVSGGAVRLREAPPNWVDVNNCGTATILSQNLTLDRPARIFSSGFANFGDDQDTAMMYGQITVQLLHDGQVVADSSHAHGAATNNKSTSNVSVSEILLDTVLPTAYDAAPGDYVLRMQGQNFGDCNPSPGSFFPKVATYFNPRLSYILLPPDLSAGQ